MSEDNKKYYERFLIKLIVLTKFHVFIYILLLLIYE